MCQVMANQVLGTFGGFWSNHTCWPSHRVGLRPTFGPADLARLPGLLCLGSAELVLPCQSTRLIRESTKGGRRPKAAAPPLWRRREAPPPLWMGVGRLVRHKESLMGHFVRTLQQLRRNIVQLRRNFVATSSQLPYIPYISLSG